MHIHIVASHAHEIDAIHVMHTYTHYTQRIGLSVDFIRYDMGHGLCDQELHDIIFVNRLFS